ncbi:hypothetical protein INT44_009030 [Umbelopsis vinacea]|uniref:Band 7 domain-containing protein n=1 Tax=Umbelopsis vinacea TaxID=44442 RepID=A0A8H7Q0B8_9FUNG|nr:hypothetical protein INT44_009030 [Umbelopsis vinacea]
MTHQNNRSEQALELTDRASSSNYPPTPLMHTETEAALGQQGLQPTYAMELGLDSIPHIQLEQSWDSVDRTYLPWPRINLHNPSGYVGLVTRFGKFYKCVDPGLVKINPVTEKVLKVDIKIQISEIPEQEIMTQDNVNVKIESVLFWHVMDPYQSQYAVTDVERALTERTQTTLRHILGGKVLQDAIENREAIAGEIQDVIEPSARLWGVKIESILIKDIMFSPELQASLSSAAQAKRVGESRVIAAKAEVDAAKLMRDAANILNTPAAMQIRYLETLSSMAKNGQGPKTIFMPLDASNKMDMRLGQPSGSQPM